MPKERKSEKYLPELPILLRHAMPLGQEIEGEQDATKRHERTRARDIARDELIRIYRQHQSAGTLHLMDANFRLVCELFMPNWPQTLKQPIGGRPTNDGRKLEIAMFVHELIHMAGGIRGSRSAAYTAAADRFGIKYESVRDIINDKRTKWQRTLRAAIAMRAIESAPTQIA